MDPEDIPTAGISRRSVLKKAAVGGAVVWAAPAITSLTSPAAAAGSDACEPGICTELALPDGTVLGHFSCNTVNANEAGCLCECAGQPTNAPCTNASPCTVLITCSPVLQPGPC